MNMTMKRRHFLWGTAAFANAPWRYSNSPCSADEREDPTLKQDSDTPILSLDSLKDPITIESMELLKQGREFLVRVRSKEGLESIAVCHSKKMQEASIKSKSESLQATV